jgi:hypothetical protein
MARNRRANSTAEAIPGSVVRAVAHEAKFDFAEFSELSRYCRLALELILNCEFEQDMAANGTMYFKSPCVPDEEFCELLADLFEVQIQIGRCFRNARERIGADGQGIAEIELSIRGGYSWSKKARRRFCAPTAHECGYHIVRYFLCCVPVGANKALIEAVLRSLTFSLADAQRLLARIERERLVVLQAAPTANGAHPATPEEPLTDSQKTILQALDGKAMGVELLAGECDVEASTLYRQGLKTVLESRGLVKHIHGLGWYRPDRPPK